MSDKNDKNEHRPLERLDQTPMNRHVPSRMTRDTVVWLADMDANAQNQRNILYETLRRQGDEITPAGIESRWRRNVERNRLYVEMETARTRLQRQQLDGHDEQDRQDRQDEN